MTDKEEVLVVGTGAMACLLAGRLSAAQIPVVMMGSWQEGLSVLREKGVRIIEEDGREVVFPVRVTSNPADCRLARFALVLVKSWQTERAAQQLASCLPVNGVALTLQNGLGNREKLAAILGASKIAIGGTTATADLLEPGVVRTAGDQVLSVGIHGQLKPLSDMLGAAGFVVETILDINSLLWGNLIINATILPITAILGVSYGELLTRLAARNLLVSAAREAASVAVAKGIHLPFPDPVVATEAIARRSAVNRSSMFQDALRNMMTEVDFINGAIVQAGEQTGITTPINRTFWLFVSALRGNFPVKTS